MQTIDKLPWLHIVDRRIIFDWLRERDLIDGW